MSFQAMKWVCDQRVGSPSAKSVLYALANYANFEGGCFASLERLGADSEQSRASVIRRLVDLERRGLIYRAPSRRKGEGRHAGEFTSSMTFLLMDSLSIAEALKHGYDPERRPVPEAEISADERDGDDEPENQGDSDGTAYQSATRCFAESNENNGLGEGGERHGVADCNAVIPAENPHHQVADCNSARVSTVQREPVRYLTLNPPKPPMAAVAAELAEGSWPGEWAKIVEAWPLADGETLERGRNRFRQMTPEDREAVLLAVPEYLADCSQKKRRPMRLKAFLAGDWRHWAEIARGLAKKRDQVAVFVVEHSRAWRAWASVLGEKTPKAYFSQGRKGYAFPSLFPPGVAAGEDLAAANVALEAAAEPAPDGVFLEVESPEFSAWAAHYARAGEAPPFAYFHPKRKVRGSLFSARWPPGFVDERAGAAGEGNRDLGAAR